MAWFLCLFLPQASVGPRKPVCEAPLRPTQTHIFLEYANLTSHMPHLDSRWPSWPSCSKQIPGICFGGACRNVHVDPGFINCQLPSRVRATIFAQKFANNAFNSLVFCPKKVVAGLVFGQIVGGQQFRGKPFVTTSNHFFWFQKVGGNGLVEELAFLDFFFCFLYLIEGSLEVKLPTIWTDEKQSRAEAERREKSEERRVEEKE